MKNITTKNRNQKRVKKTRKRLKKAALDVFSEKSVDATTVTEITERADLGKGTLYHHFSDKEEIIITLVQEAVEHLIERIRNADTPPTSLEDILEHLINAHYHFLVESKEEFLILFQGQLLLKLQSENLDELESPYLIYLEEIQSQVCKYLSPPINPIKVRRLAFAVAGFVFGFFSFALINMKKDEFEKSTNSLRHVFVKSMCDFISQ